MTKVAKKGDKSVRRGDELTPLFSRLRFGVFREKEERAGEPTWPRGTAGAVARGHALLELLSRPERAGRRVEHADDLVAQSLNGSDRRNRDQREQHRVLCHRRTGLILHQTLNEFHN